MRTKYSIKNSISAFICNIISIFIGFIAQAIFIRILGAEYLGLNGLFTNILTMLSIFELGIGSAIVFNLYKPISENNTEKIKSLMNFYKKSYFVISIVICLAGLFLLPFIEKIVGKVTIDINIYIIYLLFLVNTIASYLLAYKRNILYANQRSYLINYVHIIYLFVLNFLQIMILYLTKNYYVYLIIKIICQIFENIVIQIIANKEYPYLKEKNIKKIDKDVENDIFKKVKALIFHKIGAIIVDGTDNIIISYFFGIKTVGLYTNYNMIISSVKTTFSQIILSLTASVGNLLVTESKEKSFDIFKKIRFMNFWISSFTSICILVLIKPFITIWIGSEFLLDSAVLFTLVFNYFQKTMRNTYIVFKESGGVFVEDKFVPLIESIINIIFSIICLKLFGLVGVFVGTIISGLVLWLYSYPKFVYKNLFNRSYRNYYIETFSYILLFVIIAMISYFTTSIITIENIYINFVIKLILCIIIPNCIMLLIFHKSENYNYFKNIILTKIKRGGSFGKK